MTPWCLLPALSVALVAAVHAAEATKGVRIFSEYWATRTGLAARVLVMMPERPRAGVMLLPGGHGNINLDVQAQIGWGEDDFVIRTRASYAKAGFMALVPDVAIDRKPPAVLGDYRRSELQAEDLRAIDIQMRRTVDQVFMVAYDRGATSALNAAGRRKIDLAGLVLISPVLDKAPDADAVLDGGARFALGTLPVLMIHHGLDTCSAGAAARLKQIAAGLTPRSFQSVDLAGGSDDFLLRDPFAYSEDPCNKEARHALAGLEDRVSATVIEWLEKQLPSRP